MRSNFNNFYWSVKTKEASSDNEDTNASIIDDSNHVYFYSFVDNKSCLELNKKLQEKADSLLDLSRKNSLGRPKIYLHINSFGGSIFAGISSMDTIIRLKKDVDIITIVEGASASAGTFLSIVGTKRIITKNSFMMIHQLSSIHSGNYRELKDGMNNADSFMRMIKKFYKEYTKVPEKEIDKILEHDLWWDSDKCLEMKLVDEII